jgi:small-conductance mechanosensitive channel
MLNFPFFLDKILDIILLIWIVTQAMVAVQILINYFAAKVINTDDPGEKAAIDLLTKAVKFALWVVAILFILSNLGINITSFIAGLGIGGVAIAFALQNILSDLFSSFAIYFDKPFVVGDYIVFGDQKGTVEKIGIKTTRLRSLFGEEIIVSNKDLTSSIVQNFRKMKERRVVFNFGVTYDTPTEKLREIPQIIKKIIEEFEIARLDRVHFKKFSDFSLDFEVSYYLSTPDYNKYMDVQQEINLKIMDVFNEKKIEFAFPTQTIYSKQ